MDIDDMINGNSNNNFSKDISQEDNTIKVKFDNILNNCPSIRRVRRFIRDWLNDLDEEKKIKMLDSIFG